MIETLSRIEKKYLVPTSIADELENKIQHFTVQDNNIRSQDSSYKITSTYLDTPQNAFYQQGLNGDYLKEKFRIRSYGDTPKTDYIEIKTKQGRFSKKQRVPFHLDMTSVSRNEHIIKELRSNQNELFLAELFSRQLAPKITIRYNRKAYNCRFGSANRITFDNNIKGLAYLDHGLENTLKDISSLYGKTIVEIKCTSYLSEWLMLILEQISDYTITFSKYIYVMDELYFKE